MVEDVVTDSCANFGAFTGFMAMFGGGYRDAQGTVAAEIARFKAPRAVAVCERIERHASGKADYRWAKEAALDAVDVTGAR